MILEVKELSEDRAVTLLINQQWRGGQVISDFGFGNKKRQADEFLDDFQWTYSLKQYRIQGYDLRCSYLRQHIAI